MLILDTDSKYLYQNSDLYDIICQKIGIDKVSLDKYMEVPHYVYNLIMLRTAGEVLKRISDCIVMLFIEIHI